MEEGMGDGSTKCFHQLPADSFFIISLICVHPVHLRLNEFRRVALARNKFRGPGRHKNAARR